MINYICDIPDCGVVVDMSRHNWDPCVKKEIFGIQVAPAEDGDLTNTLFQEFRLMDGPVLCPKHKKEIMLRLSDVIRDKYGE